MMRNILIVIVLVLTTPSFGSEKKTIAANKWEYKTTWINVSAGSPNQVDEVISTTLNKYGSNGWELVDILDRTRYYQFVFKRRAKSKNES